MATDEHLVVLRGGSRDGESTTVASHVTQLLAASDAPGMIDVYTATTESTELRGNPHPARVYVFAGQEPIGDLGPEMLHMPARH